MDILKQLNAAAAYIEENLCGTLNLDKLTQYLLYIARQLHTITRDVSLQLLRL